MIDLDDPEFVAVVCDIKVDFPGSRVLAVTACDTPDTDELQSVPFCAIEAHDTDLLIVRDTSGDVDNSTWMTLSDLQRRMVMTQTGQTLGNITDAILEPTDWHVSAFVLRPRDDRLTSMLFRVRHAEAFVRPNAETHVGLDWIVVPENAVLSRQPESETTLSRDAAAVRWYPGTRHRVLAAIGILVLWIAGLEILRPLFGMH